MTMHEEWTDRLSDYLDAELPDVEHAAVEAHLRTCAACTAVLNDLKRVVARAGSLEARPPQADLWPGVAARVERITPPRRVSFTLPQLAAAAIVLMAISGTLAIKLSSPSRTLIVPPSAAVSSQSSQGSAASAGTAASTVSQGSAESAGSDANRAPAAVVTPVGFADAQYDAAVADLEKAVKNGRGRLDKATIEIVEHNLQIIDQAINQAREALVGDPANGYLSGHLVEARRRKLDLLRRATALASETD
jgi:anti-sigma factor RsiW